MCLFMCKYKNLFSSLNKNINVNTPIYEYSNIMYACLQFVVYHNLRLYHNLTNSGTYSTDINDFQLTPITREYVSILECVEK
jgi:hypothetical protein